MLTQNAINFIEDLKQNNNTEWMHANKKRYELYKNDYHSWIYSLLLEMKPLDQSLEILEAKNCTFRINRDIRFSKDKRPYKENLAASIARGGTKDKTTPGHYFHLGAGENFLAGGCYWFEEKETLLRVRNFIAQHPERFAQLIDNEGFKAKWGVIKMPNSLTIAAILSGRRAN